MGISYTNKYGLHWYDPKKGHYSEQITELPLFSPWALSPDDKYVVAANTKGGPLILVDLENKQQRHLELPLQQPQLFSWSADGKSFFLSGMFGETATYLLLQVWLDGTHRIIRTQDESWMSAPRISPNGRYLAYLNWEFIGDIWVLERQRQ